MTKLSGIDTNLLIALDALFKERSVTRAAARLSIGQPGMSHSLARLREYFKDPLLVPHGRAMVLTDKALKLVDRVARATEALADVFEERSSFDPLAARRFAFACADLFALRFVPQLFEALRREAPGIEPELRPLVTRATDQILSDGVELAFGVFEDVPPALNQQSLFVDPFVCVVGADNARVGKSLSLRTYVALQHLEVLPAPMARPGARIDRFLTAKGLRRSVATRVPYFLLAARLLAESELILTMTRMFATGELRLLQQR